MIPTTAFHFTRSYAFAASGPRGCNANVTNLLPISPLQKKDAAKDLSSVQMNSSNGHLSDCDGKDLFHAGPTVNGQPRPVWLRSCYFSLSSLAEAKRDGLDVSQSPLRRSPRRKTKRRLKRARSAAITFDDAELSLPPLGSLARTTRPPLAGLRLWE